MAQYYADRSEFEGDFSKRESKRDLFAFALFDSSDSHEPVHRFFQTRYQWMNHLADAGDMFIFAFIDKILPEERSGNVSMEIARGFDIKPNELPGILLFQRYSVNSVNRGIFLPLKLSLFSEEIYVIENVFRDLVSLIIEARVQCNRPWQLLDHLQRSVEALKRKQNARPFLLFLSESVAKVVNSPTQLIELITKMFFRVTG